MAENQLTGGGGTADTSMYPRFQPMPQVNPLAQVNDMVNLQRSFQAAQQQQLELGRGRLNYMHQQLGALAAKVDPKTMQPNATMDDVQNVIGSLTDAGVPKWQVQKELEKFQGKDSAGIQDLARQHMAQIAAHAETMGMAYGTPFNASAGGGQVFGTRNPYSPGQITAPGMSQGAAGTYLPNMPDPTKMVPGPVGRSPVTGAPQQSVLPEDVAVSIARGAKYTMGLNGQIVLQGGQTVGMPTTPTGSGEAAAVTAKTGADLGSGIERSAAGAPTRTGMLSNLEDDLGKFDSGPLAGYSLTAKRLVNDAIQRSGVPVPQWDPKSVASQENFNKQATQLAQQQFQSLGGTGTDQQLGSSIKANPNEFLSPMGNKGIISLLKGNEDAIRTMNDEWQKWKAKNGSETGSQFQNWFNNNYSPRAFQFARMGKADREEMLKNMQPNEKAALGTALKNAEDKGWIKPD
jgi:hypothetical protein